MKSNFVSAAVTPAPLAVAIAALCWWAWAAEALSDPIQIMPQPNNPDVFATIQTTGIVRSVTPYKYGNVSGSSFTYPLHFESGSALAAAGNEDKFIQTLNNFGGGWSFTFNTTTNIEDNSFVVHTYEAEAPTPPASNSDAFAAAAPKNPASDDCARMNDCVGSEFYFAYKATGGDPTQNVHWIQVLFDNIPGRTPTFEVDNGGAMAPYYDVAARPSQPGDKGFLDIPSVSAPDLPWFFNAALFLVTGPDRPGPVTVYGAIDWGWANTVSEPSTLALLGVGLAAIGFARRRVQYRRHMPR